MTSVETGTYPKKYWWVVLVVVPIVLGLIAATQVLLPRSAPGVSQTQTGIGNVAQNGTWNVNMTNADLSTKLYVTNISVSAGEYQKYQGQPLDEGLKREIDQAIAQASAGKSSESIRRFEEIVRKAPLPAIYNNLGVEYAKAGQTQLAQQAFAAAIQRDPQQQDAQKNLALLSTVKMAPPPGRPASPAVKVESSAVPTIAIEPLAPAPSTLKEVHIVESGTELGSSYRFKYNVEPGNSTIVEPGTYDIVFKSPSNATFVLARNVEVKAGTLVRINPAALVGYIQVEQLTARGF